MLMDEQAAKCVNEEQTAALKTALLHGQVVLSCRHGCEPLSGVSIPIPWASIIRAAKGESSLPAAGLTCGCIFWLIACCVMELLCDRFVMRCALSKVWRPMRALSA